MNQGFHREHKEDKPVLAICYDFDKTLSPDDMQAQGYIQSVGYDTDTFWPKSNALARDNDMDQNLAYMYLMKEEAEGQLLFKKSTLNEYGSKVQLFPGVEDWFSRIRQYGDEHGVIVEHYIISSGLKEMIEGTVVASEFKKIYASSFYYNKKGVAVWPAQVINYTNKTQFLFRIEKGVLDINDPAVNDSYAPEEIRVPFRNMVYIGDSDTDVPCMKLVNSFGGHSIGVYNSEKQDKAKVYKMMRENRIKYFAAADYSEGSEIDLLVKTIIDRTETNEKLESLHYACKKENVQADRNQDESSKEKTDLMIALETSRSFASTHLTIAEMRKHLDWTIEERETLFKIALSNGQVKSILTDPDVREFYRGLLKQMKASTVESEQVECILKEHNTEA